MIFPHSVAFLSPVPQPPTPRELAAQAQHSYLSGAVNSLFLFVSVKDDDIDLPKLPFPLPKRTSGFVYDGGHSSAPVHLSAYLDLTCADSKRVWPVIKKLAKSYGPYKLHLTVNFFALAYFNNAFRTLKV